MCPNVFFCVGVAKSIPGSRKERRKRQLFFLFWLVDMGEEQDYALILRIKKGAKKNRIKAYK